MKTTVLSLIFTLILATSKAQFSQDFEGTQSSWTGSCWSLNGVYKTVDASDVITGSGSLFTNPPSGGTRDLVSPALNVINPFFNVSFNYKTSNPVNGNATRTIEVGLLNAVGAYSPLTVITINRFSPAGVQNFNANYIVVPGVQKLVLKLGGATGDGNARLVIDDLYANASALYQNGGCNSAPVAVNDVFSAPKKSIVTGNILSNDNDPDGESLVPVTVALSQDGILVMQSNGDFVFTPNPLFNGTTTSFTYRLTDNGMSPMNSNVASVTINYFEAGSLPVSLESFNANLVQDKVKLTWTTVTEINVSHFIIERSTDGTNYTDAGMVFAAGNSTSRISYAFNDGVRNNTAKVLYYRLRSVDVDGKGQYSQIRVIRFNQDNLNPIALLTYPNPAVNELRVTLPTEWQNKKVIFELFNANGSTARKMETASSSQTENININTLPSGYYILRATCNGQVAQQKIVKQ